MITTRMAEQDDLERLKEIWRLCFGDPDAYIDLYFRTRNWRHETAVLTEEGTIVSMLAMIPAVLRNANGESRPAAMIFAVATHPEHQKKGYADLLLEYANDLLAKKQISMTALVPATDELFRFYEKRGYRTAFTVREILLTAKEIENLSCAKENPFKIHPASPTGYQSVRKTMLEGHSYLDYREEEILFEKQTAVAYGTDICLFSLNGQTNEWEESSAEGCFYAEWISEKELLVKELLVPESQLAEALRKIAEYYPASEYLVRMPIGLGSSLGGTVRPFGMLRSDSIMAGDDFYLGIAYD